MAKKEVVQRARLLMRFLLMFLGICMCYGNEHEHELLLSIKASVTDHLGSLLSWNSSLSFCQWKGVTCDSASHVTKIELYGKNLSGNISEFIFQLPFIETIDLSNNQLFSGIPPSNMSSCLWLKYLNLSNNNLTGPLPSSSLPRLETLDLSNNMLSGTVPEDIGLFSGLKVLDFGGNVLVGRIPKSITNMSSLQFLTLASNQLVGEIPPEFGLMKSLKSIYLGYNNFSGGIPNEIGELTSLYHLDLVSNNLTGEIPSSLGNLTNLKYLYFFLNKLTGPIPRSIFSLESLISLDLSDNFLTGEIPELALKLQNLEILHLFSNNLTGKIPRALSSLPHLQVLQLWSNNLSGEIPYDLGKYNNLTVLDLSTNNLTGKIPQSLCESGLLFKLILFSNSLKGELPRSLDRCQSLRRLRLQNNHLSGELSPEFTKLALVYFLDISGNNLSGTISGRKWRMPELQMLNLARNVFYGKLPDSFGSDKLENLDLSENGFSGSIPPKFGNFSELMELKLSENKLSGKIPSELSLCKKLVTLDLSHNQLSGQIPSTLSEMPVLGQLDLSVNQLSGKIPDDLGKVESLVQVNISHNRLHGSLPSTGAFLDINSSSVTGNNLCGGDAVSGLKPCKGVESRAWWFFLTCLLVVLVALAFAILIIVFIRRQNGAILKRVETDDGVWELHFFASEVSKIITIHDVLSSKREENVICRGRDGVLYIGKSAMNGVQFIVKEMNEANLIQKSAWTQVDELGKLRHPNIVSIVAMCMSEKGGFLVYEFIEGKNLSEALRGLSWDRRRRVAIGISKALRYLHCDCSSNIIVGDFSSEKIIIDNKDEPRLRLSFPGLVCMDTKRFISSAYLAPETKDCKEISEKSDIYGYGLIIVELLTGRSPADAEFGVHESIVDWARYCYSDCHLDIWVDPIIKRHALNHQNEIVETMNLALQCTAKDPAARPSARDVAKNLDLVMRTSSCVSGLNFSSTV